MNDYKALDWAGGYGYLQACIEIALSQLEQGYGREDVSKLLTDALDKAEYIRSGRKDQE